jgi:hypothetical protein
MTCWRCGAPWRCQRCGSFERRSNGKGCAECHRTYQRERDRQRNDIVITPAVRAYLNAFDAYLTATKTGDTRLIRETARDRASALHTLERNAR